MNRATAMPQADQDRPQERLHRLDRRQLRRAFARAAAGYDAAAVLQREVRGRLLERFDVIKLQPQTILDAGCGTGHGTAALRRQWPGARIIGLDIARPMLEQARRNQPRRWWPGGGRTHWVAADANRLPLPDESVDFIFSSLMLQWCDDLDAALGELRRVLRPNGLLLFSSFGPDTLRELRAAWAEVDAAPHVNRFIDMHDVGDALLRAGFDQPVMDVEHFTLTYARAVELMRDLKRIGAHNVAAGRARGLTGPRRLAAVERAYAAFRMADGRLPATYEVVYGTAWAHPFSMRRGGGPRRVE